MIKHWKEISILAILAILLVSAGTSSNTWTVGDGTPGEKTIQFSIGDGATNPKIKFNDTNSEIELSNDGSTFSPVVTEGTSSMQVAYDGSSVWSGAETMSFTQTGTNNAFSITAASLTTGIGIDVSVGANDQTRAISTNGRIWSASSVTSAGYIDGATDPAYPGASSFASVGYFANTSTTSGSGLIGSTTATGAGALGVGVAATMGLATTSDPLASDNQRVAAVSGLAINLTSDATGVGVLGISDLGIPGYFRHRNASNTNPALIAYSLNAIPEGNAIFQVRDNSYGNMDFTNNGKIRTEDSTATSDIFLESGDASAGDSGDVTLETGSATGARGSIRLVDGSEGTAGHVWTSTGTTGEGGWAAPSGGGGGTAFYYEGELRKASGGIPTANITTPDNFGPPVSSTDLALFETSGKNTQSCQIACLTTAASGTDCGVDSEIVGISCVFPEAGTYRVCAYIPYQFNPNAAPREMNVRLFHVTDGTPSTNLDSGVDTWMEYTASAANTLGRANICDDFEFTAARNTVAVKFERDVGAGILSQVRTSNVAGTNWDSPIFKITKSLD